MKIFFITNHSSYTGEMFRRALVIARDSASAVKVHPATRPGYKPFWNPTRNRWEVVENGRTQSLNNWCTPIGVTTMEIGFTQNHQEHSVLSCN